MDKSCVIECPNCDGEKTVRRAPCGHGASPVRDVRKAPTTERSFLAGEIEAEFRFRNHRLGHSDIINYGFRPYKNKKSLEFW
jgi:hypothetical protein